jgi:hypothetical protein
MTTEQRFVTEEVLELKLAVMHEKLDRKLQEGIDVARECLAEQKRTNGTLREHEARLDEHDRRIAKIWTIGTTLWAGITAAMAWATAK